MTAINVPRTPLDHLWPRKDGGSVLRTAVLVVGTGLLAVSAHIQVPFWPVRLSMQTFVVLALGMAYGARLGATTILAYLAEGAFGMPVFQGGSGWAYMAGPTGGFLVGFVLAALIMGYCSERGVLKRVPMALGAIVLAEGAIYVPGVAWLAVLFGPADAIAFGVVPFVPGEALKMALALVPVVRRVTIQRVA